MTPDPQPRSLVGTRRFATTVIGTWGVVLWNPWTRQLKSDLTRPPVVLCYCGRASCVSGYGATAGWSEGERAHRAKVLTHERASRRMLPRSSLHSTEGIGTWCAATRDELPNYQARTRDRQIHRSLTASTLFKSSQSGPLKPIWASVYSWHSPGPS